MTMHQWHEQISFLKKVLNDEIASREKTFESTIPNYLCLNNLKSKLTRLEVIERNLAIDKYTLAFIGTIGEGKTTAICHLFNFVGEFNVSKTIAGKVRTITLSKRGHAPCVRIPKINLRVRRHDECLDRFHDY